MSVYRVPLNALVLSTSKVDIFSLTTSASQSCRLEEIRLDPIAASVADFALTLHVFSGSYTAGTGGTTITAAPVFSQNAASSTTAKVGTTQTAVGSGTDTLHDVGSFNLVNGWSWQPVDPDHRIIVPVSCQFVLSLDTTPASQTLYGCLIFRE